jgi:hypothetical protein
MRLIGYLRGLFAEIVIMNLLGERVTIAINGTMVRQNYSNECIADLKAKNNVNIVMEFATLASENFYKQSGILISAYRIANAIDRFNQKQLIYIT